MRKVPAGIQDMRSCCRSATAISSILTAASIVLRYVVRTTPGRVSDQITQIAIAIISSDQNG